VSDDGSIDLPGADLADAIRLLRAQLSQAMREGSAEDLRFGLGPIEVEFEVVLTKEAGVGGGVRFWVVSAEAKGMLTRASTHRVKVELQPLVRDPKTGDLSAPEIGDVVDGRPA
jgi:hypothetical protein